MSPSQHRAGRTGILTRIPNELYIKFKKFADTAGTTMTDILLNYIIEITKDVTITAKDYSQNGKRRN